MEKQKRVRRSGQVEISNKRVIVRLTESELFEIRSIAQRAKKSTSEIMRESSLRTNVWTAKDKTVEKERTRQIAIIGNNLNQIARWVNQHKQGTETIHVLRALDLVNQNIKKLIIDS